MKTKAAEWKRLGFPVDGRRGMVFSVVGKSGVFASMMFRAEVTGRGAAYIKLDADKFPIS